MGANDLTLDSKAVLDSKANGGSSRRPIARKLMSKSAVPPRLGQERGNAQEKTFASQMITDHTKTSEGLKSIAPADAKAAIPTAHDSSSQNRIDKLKNAKPDDFSSDFDSMQVSAHKDAVSLFERYAKGGEDPKLKDWAGKTLPALQHHLEMAQNLGKTK
jgi:putative membrane protein